MRICICTLAFSVVFTCAVFADGIESVRTQNWSSLHNGGNTSISLARLPLHWGDGDGIRWQVRLPGYGQSAPIIWGDRVFATAIDGDQKESGYVLAFDLKSGKEFWRHPFRTATRSENSYMVSRAAPTPVVDEAGVYALFESGDLRALGHDGTLRWEVSLFDDGKDRFENTHGYGASPTQTETAVVVVVDHRGPSYLAAICKKTGEFLWKTARASRSSWTSPQVARVGGREQIVVSSAGTVDGYDAVSGEPLWSHGGLSGNRIPSVTVSGDRLIVGADVGNREKDADSVQASNRCLKIDPSADDGYQLMWKGDRAVSHYVSPLAHGKYVYFINKVGVLYCVDAETGREVYARRTAGPCWAQPIATGEYVYLFHKDGQTTVVSAGPDFAVIAENRMWPKSHPPLPTRDYEYTPVDDQDSRPSKPAGHYRDPLVYGVAAVEGAFVVRLGTHLFCVGSPDSKPGKATDPFLSGRPGEARTIRGQSIVGPNR